MITDETLDIVESRLQFRLKQQQRNVVSLLCGGVKNVFAFWSTGFGKSVLYMIPPLLLDEVEYVMLVGMAENTLCTFRTS